MSTTAPWRERAAEIVREGFDGAARRWERVRPGGRLVGCFPVYSPFEIYHAAGFLPVGLIGAGGSLELTHADSRFQSFVCSIAKSTLEQGLQARLDAFDTVVFHSICDVARNLASVFERNFPLLRVMYLHLPQNAPGPEAEAYLAAELERVLHHMADHAGRPVPEAALRDSIRRYNRARGFVRRLFELRAASPERVSASETFLLLRAGTLLPPDDWSALLADALADAESRRTKVRDRIRVVLAGAFCEPPPLELVEAIEDAGCYILDDDLLLGWRWFQKDVPEDGDPVRALASAYLRHSRPSSVRHDPSAPREKWLVDRVRRVGAQAVLYAPAKFCEPALFDYVLYRRELEAAAIPHLVVEFEEKMWTFEKARNEVETFVESILFE